MVHPPRILFTAFEPSGDALAAAVVDKLNRLQPGMEIHGLGGPKMQAREVRMIETTTHHAAMFLGVASLAYAHYKRLKRLKKWLKQNPIDLLVPVDSPAANWSICRLVRRYQPSARIVHLAAPQLWAWAPWRIRKLRKFTDHVLCLLPFEPQWFSTRGVPASFVGHPIFAPPPESSKPPESIDPHNSRIQLKLPPRDSQGCSLKINSKIPPPSDRGGERLVLALLPGSRVSEIRSNGPAMLQAAARLHERHPQLICQVAAVDEQAAGLIQQIIANDIGQPAPGWLWIKVDRVDEILSTSDAGLVVSGTATLLTAARRVPMVVVYYVNPWVWRLAGRWLMRTPFFALPNLISNALGLGRAVPEWVPHFGQVKPIVEELEAILCDKGRRLRQQQVFDQIIHAFEGFSYSDLAAKKCMECVDLARGRGAGCGRTG